VASTRLSAGLARAFGTKEILLSIVASKDRQANVIQITEFR
jgi:hypothetical protein